MKKSLAQLPPLTEVKNSLARKSLRHFTRETFPGYDENWHHTLLCERIENWAFGDCDRLIIEIPPRHGKSEIVSRRLPAYIFGRDPDAKIIATSYGADLAKRMNRDVQRIIDSPRYRDIFPNTELMGKTRIADPSYNYTRTTDYFEIINNTGSYTCAGVGGAITGMGFTHGIIDDPYKNRAEANSPTIRRKIWEWFTSTFYTRKQGVGKILITMTRWHESDLAGQLQFLQENDPDADKWEIISMPALAEKNSKYRDIGDPLWPQRYGLEDLRKTKAVLGTYEWNALYQQHPSPVEGGIIHRNWWQYYNTAPTKFDEIIQSWDLALEGKETSDYVVGMVVGRIGADRYLLDLVRDRMDFVQTIRAIRQLSEKWPEAFAKIVENKANGPAAIATLKKEIPGIIPFTPQGDKLSRLMSVSPQVESGNVYLPVKAYWVHDFVEEITSFPNGANDDQVDAFSQALLRFIKNRGIISLDRSSFRI